MPPGQLAVCLAAVAVAADGAAVVAEAPVDLAVSGAEVLEEVEQVVAGKINFYQNSKFSFIKNASVCGGILLLINKSDYLNPALI